MFEQPPNPLEHRALHRFQAVYLLGTLGAEDSLDPLAADALQAHLLKGQAASDETLVRVEPDDSGNYFIGLSTGADDIDIAIGKTVDKLWSDLESSDIQLPVIKAARIALANELAPDAPLIDQWDDMRDVSEEYYDLEALRNVLSDGASMLDFS